MNDSDAIRRRLRSFQKDEITEHRIYMRLSRVAKSAENRRILEKIAGEEFQHYRFWRTHTREDTKPDALKVWTYYMISRVCGFTFGAKLMERGEAKIRMYYEELRDRIPHIDALIRDEDEHEQTMLGLLDEQSLRYTSSIILGLNDALVELTGALAGLTLALQQRWLIALTGLITGIAAALSMGASEYLSTQSEAGTKSPLKASLYTGGTYLATVLVLILPYLVLPVLSLSLTCTLVLAIIIIAIFNYYIAVAKDVPFGRRFLEMAVLSLGVAAISFLVGYFLRSLLGVEG